MSDLPPGWEWATLDELAAPEERSITDGPFGSNLKSAHYTSSGARVLRLQNIGDGEFRDERAYISEEHFERLRAHEARHGDLLIASLGDAPPRACLVPVIDGHAIVKADCARVRLSRAVDPQWVLYTLLSPTTKQRTASLIKGVGRPRLGLAQIRKLPVPVPPLFEQRRIVSALDSLLSNLHVGTEILQTLTGKASELRDQAIAASISDSTVPICEQPELPVTGVNDEGLPRIPADWQWKRLGDIADVVGGITKDAKKQGEDFREVPYLRVANVQRGTLDLSNLAWIRASEQKISQLTLHSGDVLLNEGGDRDKLARGWVWQGEIPECIHQNHVFRARIRDAALHPKILAWHANSFGQRWAQANGKQSVNLASISLKMILLMPVPIPPVAQQQLIVERVEKGIASAERLKNAIQAGSGKAGQLRRSLLSEAFAGRLVPQDSDDEPASVLLDRIRAERAAQSKPRRTRSKPQ